MLFLIGRELSGAGAYLGQKPELVLLLAGAGIVTAVPLLLFGHAAKTLSLSLLGLTQYLAPTISLLLGILLYHEDFSNLDLAAFVIIWIALGLFTYGQFNQNRNQKAAVPIGE